ncbi:TonB-dependent receptor [Granulicella mallensis]|uniref:TonB-dependent receptor, plug n=1 Tax=Granulicella mallensis (strain ATCC BAA-1857 / DSM 23137 / MP5ACTX8) TaxID=682795 RepID=G8NSZ7_GRAMM|nr:TonB-dependent receptor [Granulicella mallensis]AEU36340.1 TonB-dependent receptor, plug [Granulicella mallensis MP5ACTX8]
MHLQRNLRNCTLVLVLALLACIPSFAQTITGSITGTVTDPSGAVVPGAKVVATNVLTGVATPTTTNPNGIYSLRFLQIGQYKVTVASPNFASQTTSVFTLEVDQEARINIGLKIGEASSTVVVTDTAPILNTENATTGDTITAEAATELPVQSRNFSSLTLLVAGAISPNPQALDNVGRGAYNGGFDVNGNREQSNNYTLDGADINEAIDNYIGYSPNVDALGEVRIITGNSTAEYGNANGGQVVMVTKSGTNKFHGNLFFFGENQNLNANTWAAKHAGAARAPFNRAMFGGTLGGPILHDKLFFFMDYQGARQHFSTVELRAVVPTALRSGPNVTNPAALYLFAHPELYPEPNSPGINGTVTANYVGSSGQATVNDQGDVKIDWNVRKSDTISGRLSIGREHDGYSKVALPTDIPTNNNDPYTGFILNWTHVFSPSIVNEARGGIGRTRYIQTPTDVSGQWGLTGNAKLGIPGTQLVPGFSTLVIGNTANSGFVDDIGAPQGQDGNGSYGGIDSDSIVNAFTYGDNLTWQLGKQTLKFGGQALRYQENRYYSGNDGTLGWFGFNGNVNQFLSDQVTSEAQGALTGRWGQRQWRDAFFVQDDYKFTSNLTLNFGLRWEYDQPYTEVNNKQANINITTGVITDAGVNGAPRALYNAFYAGFMPRLGFAWSPNFLQSKFVVRGGYGMTNFLEGTGANLRLTLNPPFFVDASCTNIQPCANGAPFLSVTNGFYRPSDPNVFAGNVRAWQPTLKPALIQQFNLTTEYQLDDATSLTVAYIGQDGTHLVDPRQANQAACLTCALPIATLSKVNPALSQITSISYTESEAMMNYNSLQVTARRRATHGLEFLANWTYSKGLSNNLGYYGASGGAGDSQSAYWQDSYNGGADYGPTYFDAKHNVSISGIYQLPFGRGRQFGGSMNRIEDEVVGGWKVSTIMSFHTGFPITVNSDAFYSNTVNANAARGNHLRALKIVGRTETKWFGTDPSALPCPSDTDNGVCAYSEQSASSFGNAAVGSERDPGYQQIDLAFSKDFRVTEGSHFEFRSDFLNAFNMVSLAPPSNSASSAGGFGQISNTVNEPRNIQLALKFVF